MAGSYGFIRRSDLDGGGDPVATLRQGLKNELLADKSYDPDDGDSWARSGVGASEQTISVKNQRSGESENVLLCPLS